MIFKKEKEVFNQNTRNIFLKEECYMARSFRRATHTKARFTYKLFVYGLVLIMLILVIKASKKCSKIKS